MLPRFDTLREELARVRQQPWPSATDIQALIVAPGNFAAELTSSLFACEEECDDLLRLLTQPVPGSSSAAGEDRAQDIDSRLCRLRMMLMKPFDSVSGYAGLKGVMLEVRDGRLVRGCLNFCVRGALQTCPRRRALLATNARRGGQVGASYAAVLVKRSS